MVEANQAKVQVFVPLFCSQGCPFVLVIVLACRFPAESLFLVIESPFHRVPNTFVVDDCESSKGDGLCENHWRFRVRRRESGWLCVTPNTAPLNTVCPFVNDIPRVDLGFVTDFPDHPLPSSLPASSWPAVSIGSSVFVSCSPPVLGCPGMADCTCVGTSNSTIVRVRVHVYICVCLHCACIIILCV